MSGDNLYLEWALAQQCDHPIDRMVLGFLAMKCDESGLAGGLVRVRLQDLIEALGGDSVMTVRALIRLDTLGLIYLMDINAVVFCTLPSPTGGA